MSAYAPTLRRAHHVVQAVRPRLFGVAYRVLGSAADADDVVQDAWMR
jgi:RNA polymerase sigma-70 factor, ECF subfamily